MAKNKITVLHEDLQIYNVFLTDLFILNRPEFLKCCKEFVNKMVYKFARIESIRKKILLLLLDVNHKTFKNFFTTTSSTGLIILDYPEVQKIIFEKF